MSVHDMIDDGFHPDLATTLASTLFALERLAGLRLSIVQTDHGRWTFGTPAHAGRRPSLASDGVQVYEGPDIGVTAFATGVVWAMGEPKAKPRGARA
jgi:hypothetical protein